MRGKHQKTVAELSCSNQVATRMPFSRTHENWTFMSNGRNTESNSELDVGYGKDTKDNPRALRPSTQAEWYTQVKNSAFDVKLYVFISCCCLLVHCYYCCCLLLLLLLFKTRAYIPTGLTCHWTPDLPSAQVQGLQASTTTFCLCCTWNQARALNMLGNLLRN